MLNTRRLLDQFFSYKRSTADFGGRDVTVNLINTTSYDLKAFLAESALKTYNVHTSPERDAHVLSCAPPSGSKYLHMVIHVADDDTANCMWTGATYGFYQDMNKDVVHGVYIKDGNEVEKGEGTFWLLLPTVTFTDTAAVTQLQDTMGTSGFHNSAMHLRVEGKEPVSGPLAEFLAQLRRNPWVHCPLMPTHALVGHSDALPRRMHRAFCMPIHTRRSHPTGR